MDPVSGSEDAGRASHDASNEGMLDAGSDAESSGHEPDAGPQLDASEDGDANLPGDASAGEQDAAPEDAGPALTEDEKLAKALEDRLRACGVVTGMAPFNVGKVEDEFDRCVANCAVEANCADLRGALCGTSDDASPYGSCSGACLKQFLDHVGSYPSDGFVCDTGHVIPHMYVCDDGKALDCNAFRVIKRPVSDDEVGCSKFTCKSGAPAQISRKFVCDGLAGTENGGCSDGSDEEGCASFCAE
jgi:hypothetical protein